MPTPKFDFRQFAQPIGEPGAPPQAAPPSVAMAKAEAPSTPMPEWGELSGNIIPSFKQLGKDIIEASLNPIDTLSALWGLSVGTLQAAGLPVGDEGDEETFEAFKDMMVDRYGSLENAKRTIIEDPAGFLSDVATPFTGGAGAIKGVASAGLKIAGKTSKIGRLAGKIAKSARKVGEATKYIDPVTMTTKGTSKVIKGITGKDPVKALSNIIKDVPKKLYGAGLSGRMRPSERYALALSGLKERIPLTEKGMAKLREKKSRIGEAVDEIIRETTEKGEVVSREKILEGLMPYYEDILKTPTPQAKEALLVKVTSEFVEAHPEIMTPEYAQQLKKGTYEEVTGRKKKAYEPDVTTTAETEILQKIGSGLKEGLEELDPRIKPLNVEYGKLAALSEAIDPTTKRGPGGLGLRDIGAGTVGGVTGGPFGAAVAVGAERLLRSPRALGWAALASEGAAPVLSTLTGPTGREVMRTTQEAERRRPLPFLDWGEILPQQPIE